MGLFADLIPKTEPESVEQQLEIQQPKLPADPQGVTPGLFSDLVNPQEKFQPGIVDRFLLALDKPVKVLLDEPRRVIGQGIKQAGLNTIDNLLGIEQWVGEVVEGVSTKEGSKSLKKWGKNLAESSKALAQEFDTYRSEHPEEAMQISPDAGFWEATKQIVTSPENMTKGIIQAIPMMLEAWAGGAAFKAAGLAPRTLATVQRWGRIGGMTAGIFGSNYSDARKKNVSPEAATAQAFLTSLGEGIVEEWTLGKKIGLFKSAKTALLKKSMGRLASTVLIGGSKAYARGAGEEAVQQLNSNFWNFVFTDRSQELMKGVSQAAAIGGPMEMAMAGVFTSAGVGARYLNKTGQMQVLDKFDDFVEQADLTDSEKAEVRQVIENKRQEISQTSILPVEEETTPQGEIAAEKPAPPAPAAEKPSFDEVQPENMPGLSPEEAHQEVKIENDWENTVNIIIKGIESAAEPLAEQDVERKYQLAQKVAKLRARQADPTAKLVDLTATLVGEYFHQKYAAIDITPEQQQALVWHIRESPTLTDSFKRLTAEKGLVRLLQGREIQPAQLRDLRDALGKKGEDLTDAVIKRPKKFQPKWYDTLGAIWSAPISLMSSGELSGLGRQGWFIGLMSPGAWKKGFDVAHEIAFAKDYKDVARKAQTTLTTHPMYKFMVKKMGIEFTDWRTPIPGTEAMREEHYRSGLLQKVPGIGQVVGRSEAAYTVQLNTMRLYAALKYIDAWKGQNKTSTDYEMLGKLINLSTGRGDIKALKTLLPIATASFFAPKLFVSRFQLPIHLLRTMVKSPAVFKIMAQQTAAFVGLGVLALAMLSAIPGVDVEDDPESSDFGKIKYGNLRFSFWQGYEQIARTMVQLVTGRRKSTVTGRRIQTERTDILKSYLRTKLSPSAGLAWDVLSKKKFDGSPFEWTAMNVAEATYERITPMFWQDLVDAARFEGLDGFILAAPVGFYGGSIGTYPVRPEQQAVLVKEDLSHRTFGKGWDEIGPIAQQLLREHNPQIEESEAVAKQQREGYPYLEAIAKEETLSKKRIYRSLPNNVQDEIDMSYTEIGGLSRRVGNDWYLNDKNYEMYNANVSKYLNKILPKLVASDGYKLLTTDQKKELLEDAISQIRTAVREQIIENAERKDVQDLQERMKK